MNILHRRKFLQIITYLCLLLLLLLLAGACTPGPQSERDDNQVPSDDGLTEEEEGTNPPEEDSEPAPLPVGVEPNEVGRIMILMYHRIGEPEGEWTRTPENFRRDLERLYSEGYRLISLQEFLANRIDVPAGYTPVILTFDDGTRGQFNYLEEKGEPVIDPNCAVGILQAFHRENPDFGLAATFYINYGTPFGQGEYVEEKLQYLVEQGFEIGNHTFSHGNLRNLDPIEVQRELALHAAKTRDYVPGYQVNSLALPFGASPQDPSLLKSGSYQGHPYTNDAVLLVGAEPAFAPTHRDFNPYRLPRIRADGKHLDQWLTYFQNNPEERYISDGDTETVTVPAHREELVDKSRLGNKGLHIY